ncbi:MGT2 magnesium transporter [Trypanosoma rangeli]|uniref:MGT2 magnesium transporter n=1 Tax=Trypanosoma rangeli TaxID=5698 RepID=A0A3R7N746_TRYRA|nr:MGT2 magnesium transporter [Trypanosoma rangeli]RNE97697.1 MGT2 magnesium transporter [Trypanosoma rangeli]|eukprot:RNE97697.1 MGT2 magnesium transporter [Trypanosoma rangeli]
MVMLVAPGRSDQPDLLRRISMLRRRMSAENARLYLKEKLLQELMGPTMRTTFVSHDPCVMQAYREVFAELSQVLERMEVARDSLNHVNLNFVNAVSMRMSQASAGFDLRMMFISQITTICLPMNLIASFFGMNCKVPWSADDVPNLNCFWSVVGIMCAWALICMFQPVQQLIFQKKWMCSGVRGVEGGGGGLVAPCSRSSMNVSLVPCERLFLSGLLEKN